VRDSTACLQCGIKRKQHRAQRCRRARLASTQRPLWWLAGLRAAGRSRGVECCIGRCGNVVSVPTPCLQRAFNHDRRTARRVFNFERAIVSQQGGPCVVSAPRAQERACKPGGVAKSEGGWRVRAAIRRVEHLVLSSWGAFSPTPFARAAGSCRKSRMLLTVSCGMCTDAIRRGAWGSRIFFLLVQKE
jgi:hypothetical protein